MHNERFSRIQQMLGDGAMRRLSQCSVTVVGLGAVGGYVVEALARSGVGALRLVDFDRVQPSNINRQLFALESTQGRLKCEVAAQRVLDIHPHCEAVPAPLFINSKSIGEIFEQKSDLIIDAIDSLGPKVELLATARLRRRPVLSSMGAALRTDPTCIRIGPLSEARCPLAKYVRKRLRRRDIEPDIPCVYSIEPTYRHAIVPADQREDEDHLPARGRQRDILGSLPTITGIFGLTLANEALRKLVGEHFPTANRP